MKEQIKTLVYPKSTKARRLVIELDPEENYEGSAPAMVRLFLNEKEADCCTWNIVEAGLSPEDEAFTDQEWDWLHSMHSKVQDFIESLVVNEQTT